MKNRLEPFTILDKNGKDRAFHLFDEMVHLEGAKSADHDLQYVTALREQYPDLIVTAVPQVNANIVAFSAAGHAKLELDTESDSYASWKGYVRPAVRAQPGLLGEAVQFAKYHLQWKDEHFIVYAVQIGFSAAQYILKEKAKGEKQYGPSSITDDLIMAVGEWQAHDNEVIWIYDGYWRQDRRLFKQVKHATWDKVILDENMKKDLTQVSTTFFSSKQVYEDLGVPWKRGLLFHGPPGNGKTVSVKALMHTLLYERKDDPIPTLYVRNAPYPFMIGDIFRQARQLAPCMLVLEDVESIVTPVTRSYFFNELDGLDNNDGIFLVATTNYLERLDPGLTKRPSRFDRKYLFPLPNEHERVLYIQFWRKKLANSEVDFPEKLCVPMARITGNFSFAFLQECFVATMLTLAHKEKDDSSMRMSRLLAELPDADELDKYELWREFSRQAKILRKQIDEEDMMRAAHPSALDAQTDVLARCTAASGSQSVRDQSMATSADMFGATADWPRGYLPFKDQKQPEINTSVWSWVGPRQF